MMLGGIFLALDGFLTTFEVILMTLEDNSYDN